jgi:hypothetical protein
MRSILRLPHSSVGPSARLNAPKTMRYEAVTVVKCRMRYNQDTG